MPNYVAFYVTLIAFWVFPVVLNGIMLIAQLNRERRWTRSTIIRAIGLVVSTLVAAEFIWIYVRFLPHKSLPMTGTVWFLLVLLLVVFGVVIFWNVRVQLPLYHPLEQAASPKHDRKRRRAGPTRRNQRVARLQRANHYFGTRRDSDG